MTGRNKEGEGVNRKDENSHFFVSPTILKCPKKKESGVTDALCCKSYIFLSLTLSLLTFRVNDPLKP